ncbi:hypothetical protein [Variovorax sp. YR216]|uniref:hypothetical protein n=1 Tax=Variovorax sp. YR216 TaxID=1882828 RepID=UPI000898BA16|nr:hypothetical protein [Variovorax sp. YR216]SEA87158.1 hypothetical protein SAMN05444680_10471 [Variovorax sp. YR216]
MNTSKTGGPFATPHAGESTNLASARRDPMFKVSAISLWKDHQWFLASSVPGSPTISINFEFELHDGSKSTESKYSILLESCKEVTWGMITVDSWWGARLKPSSVSSVSVGIRELFKWMVFNELQDFSQLNDVVQGEYLRDLPLLIVNRTAFYEFDFSKGLTDFLSDESLPNPDIELLAWSEVGDEGDDEDEDSEGVVPDGIEHSTPVMGCGKPEEVSKKGLSYSQASLRVNVIYYIFAQGASLAAHGLPTMPAEAFSGASAAEVTKQLAKHVVNRTPPLPDEVALPLLEEAIVWIDEKSHDVLRLQGLYLSEFDFARTMGPRQQWQYLNDVLHSFEFSVLDGGTEPWHGKIEAREVVRPEFDYEATLSPTQILRELVLTVRDAALTILLYLVGLRASEVCSPKIAETSDSLIPGCVSMRLNKAGTMELYFLHGLLSKGVDTPRAEQWLIGSCPCGSKILPITVRAIKVVESLFKPWRELSGLNQLFLNFSQPKSLPQSVSSVVPISRNAVGVGLKRFVYSRVDLSHLPDTNERAEDLWKYRDSRGWCIRAGQGRKTFAAYILESRTSLLPSVQHHFKHFNDSVTESAYFPAVFRLRQEAESVRAAETVNWFSMALDGVPIYGGMAGPISEWFDSLGLKELNKGEREEVLSNMVRLHDLRIFFSDHGNCLIKARPLASKCQQLSDTESWAAVAPNFEVRTPSMCAGCPCFVWDPSHLPFWIARGEELGRAVASADKGNLGEFRVLSERLDRTTQIIRLTQKGKRNVQ